MSGFTCSSTSSITSADATTAYSGTNPILPSTMYNASNRIGRDPYGPLDQSVINQRVESIIGSAASPNSLVAPSIPSESTDGTAAYSIYEGNLRAFIIGAKAEYCHYFTRYKYYLNASLRQIINVTSGTENVVSDDNLIKAAEFNTRLIDFTMILNTLANSMSQRTGELAGQTNRLNGEIASNFQRLKAQADILKSEAPAAELKRRMVDYTKEKAKATNNLLSLYFFLDIVALGMLFYVYKASSA